MGESKLYKIGELAQITGKTPRALRLYEELQLLVPRTRTDGGFRLYGPEAIERLGWVDCLQLMGLSLSSISLILSNLADGREGREAMGELRQTFESCLGKIQHKIADLERVREEIINSMSFFEECRDCLRTNLIQACRGCDKTTDGDLPNLVKGLIARAPGDGEASSGSGCG